MIRNDGEIDFTIVQPKYFGNHVEVPREGLNRGNKSRIKSWIVTRSDFLIRRILQFWYLLIRDDF